MGACICIIVTGTNISFNKPHETNVTNLTNITKNTTNLTNVSQTTDQSQRDTGIYAPDSDSSSSYSADSYQYQSTDYSQSSQSSQSYDSGQSSDSSQSTDSGSQVAPDPGQSEQTSETADFQ
jgi:hypothetical protein